MPCEDQTQWHAEQAFCCRGCALAFEILTGAGLRDYYRLNATPGISFKTRDKQTTRYAELEDERILCQICDFQDDRTVDVTLAIPQIHCSSCVWLLENLYRLVPGIRSLQVDSYKKTVSLSYNRGETTLRRIAETLATLGYAPDVRDKSRDSEEVRQTEKKRLFLKIGVAGFCFGNVMLLSFPEYLLGQDESLGEFQTVFAFLTLLLSMPVFFYSASYYFRSALRALQTRIINIDVPLALGLFALFMRSVYDILILRHIAYLDSFTGLVFFLLIGRAFKEKTFEALHFERHYESYFPLSLKRLVMGVEHITPLADIRPGDVLRLRNQDIIPADSILNSARACIDYSFVTGESRPQTVQAGDHLYAGGRQIGESIEIQVLKPVSQSHLTRLWNNSVFKENKRRRFTQISDRIGRHFTWATLAIGLFSGMVWSTISPAHALPVVTAVLLVACPCALALAFPFTFGTAMRILGRHGVYLKNMEVLETLSWINTVIFDKTGTLTHADRAAVRFVPATGQGELSAAETRQLQSLICHSAHPLSLALHDALPKSSTLPISGFAEVTGQGLSATIENKILKIGSAVFVTGQATEQDPEGRSTVFIAFDGHYRGHFVFTQTERTQARGVIAALAAAYRLFLLSGDDARDQQKLAAEIFQGHHDDLHFRQSPQDKMDFAANQMQAGRFVAMVGDGLNDAGALRQSDIGIAIADDINSFSPASDMIVAGASFRLLPQVFAAAKLCIRVLYATVALSLFYNVVGLIFAVSGKLSPLVSAVLMPISSISVMTFAALMTRHGLGKLGFTTASPSATSKSIFSTIPKEAL